MQDVQARINDLAKSLGIEIPEDRLAAVAENYVSSLAEAEEVRSDEPEMPVPATFDASWESKS